MNRGYEFDFATEAAGAGGARLEVTFARDYDVAGLLQEVPANTVLPALQLYASAAGEAVDPPTADVSASAISFPLPQNVAETPWQIMTLINLVHFATFKDEPEEERMLTQVKVHADAAASMSLEELKAALAAEMEAARDRMTERLPEDYEVHHDLGRLWPVDSRDFIFNVTLTLNKTQADENIDPVKRLYETMDSLVAWTAFDVEDEPSKWLEYGWIPYPYEVTVAANSISYSVEMPPSDFALAMEMANAALAKLYNVEIADWAFDIDEGW